MVKKVKSLEDIAELDIITTEDEQNLKEYEEEKEEINCTEIVKKIQEVCEKLCVIDNYFDSLNDEQSRVDEELSDLCHYIENNDLKPTQCTKIVKAIKDKRLERREIVKDIEIRRVYNLYKNRLCQSEQRQFFISEIWKAAKNLNTEYKNRRYTDEDFKNLFK